MLFSFPETHFFFEAQKQHKNLISDEFVNYLIFWKNGRNLRAYRLNDFQIQESLVIL